MNAVFANRSQISILNLGDFSQNSSRSGLNYDCFLVIFPNEFLYNSAIKYAMEIPGLAKNTFGLLRERNLVDS